MSYPSTLDDIATVAFGQQITSSLENSVINAVNAIEETVGVNPQGDYDTVGDRLAVCLVNDGFTKGDILVATGSTLEPLPVGADGQVLTVDSAQTAGVKWSAAGSGIVPVDNGICDGRLTLASGTPVTTSDVVGASTVYFTPYRGNRIALYDGTTEWQVYAFTEASLALASLATGSNYDVFAYWNSGSLTLALSDAWTSDTVRADAVVFQDGAYVNDADTTQRYVGTIRTTGAGTTEQGNARKYVWNYYNRVDDSGEQGDNTSSWTQGTPDAWSAMDGGNAGWKHEMVIGWSEDIVEAYAIVQCCGNGTRLGIGLDRTNGSDSASAASGLGSATNTLTSIYRGRPGIGYHYFNGVQASYNGTATYYGLGPGQFSVRTRR